MNAKVPGNNLESKSWQKLANWQISTSVGKRSAVSTVGVGLWY